MELEGHRRSKRSGVEENKLCLFFYLGWLRGMYYYKSLSSSQDYSIMIPQVQQRLWAALSSILRSQIKSISSFPSKYGQKCGSNSLNIQTRFFKRKDHLRFPNFERHHRGRAIRHVQRWKEGKVARYCHFNAWNAGCAIQSFKMGDL